jgi:phosphotransferase system HPr (HPr) family protein
MIEQIFVIQNKLGLHARPSALFVQTTHRHQSEVRVVRDGQGVDGKSIMGILTLAAEKGTPLTISVDGPDEQELMGKIQDLFHRKFDEE